MMVVGAVPELVVGHSYRVQLVTGLITPIRFYPYVLSGTTYVADTTLVDGVNITVVKVWEPNGDSYYTSQYGPNHVSDRAL